MTTNTTTAPAPPEPDHRVAPWWLGYLFISPIRRLWEHPVKLLARWVCSGDRVLDFGCSMGYFSLDLARLVGRNGRVICTDVQPRVLDTLGCRARRRNLFQRLELRTCTADDPNVDDLREKLDFILAYHVIHEVGDPARVIGKLAAALKPGGKIYLAEPKGHVSGEQFARECELVRGAGLKLCEGPQAWRQMTAVYEKPRPKD
jgi:SAM-dependent methyltransferase